METLIVTGIRTKEFAKDAKGQIIVENGLPVLSENDLTNKLGHKFKVLEFSTPSRVYTQTSDGSMKAIKRPVVSVGGYTIASVSALPSKKGRPDDGYDYELNEEVQGSIVKRRVEEYEVNGKKVNTASVITLANTEDKEAFELDVQQRFKSKGHVLTGMSAEQLSIASSAATNPLPEVVDAIAANSK